MKTNENVEKKLEKNEYKVKMGEKIKKILQKWYNEAYNTTMKSSLLITVKIIISAAIIAVIFYLLGASAPPILSQDEKDELSIAAREAYEILQSNNLLSNSEITINTMTIRDTLVEISDTGVIVVKKANKQNSGSVELFEDENGEMATRENLSAVYGNKILNSAMVFAVASFVLMLCYFIFIGLILAPLAANGWSLFDKKET